MPAISRPVVVGVCDVQRVAVTFALTEARLRRTSLRVVHSAAVPIQTLGVASVVSPGFMEEAGQEVLDDVRRLVDQLDSGADVTYAMAREAPVEALEIEARAAQLLVLGADDVAWYERLLRSRIAGHLAQHAACAVAVVPDRPVADHADGVVVVTLDGATSAAGPLRFAFEEAEARGRTLHVLHAVPPGTTRADADQSVRNVTEILAGWGQEHPGVEVTEGLAVGDAGDAIVRATLRADLVVLGRPHDVSLPARLSRPAAVKILEKAQCPVVVVPTDGSRR